MFYDVTGLLMFEEKTKKSEFSRNRRTYELFINKLFPGNRIYNSNPKH